MNDLLSISIFCIIIFICVFGIVDRICKCKEHCASVKAYSNCLSKDEVIELAGLKDKKLN